MFDAFRRYRTSWAPRNVTKALAEDVSGRILSFSSELSLFKRNILQPYTNVWNHKQAADQRDGETGQLLLLLNIVK